MKKYFLPCLLFICFVATMLSVRQFFSTTNNLSFNNSQDRTVLNSNAPPVNIIVTNQTADNPTNTLNDAGCFFKTIIDNKSGQYAIVNPDRRIVLLKNKDGSVIWSAVVVAPGESEIGVLIFEKNRLFAVVGRHTYFSIDMKTGKVTPQGSD